MSSFGFSTIAAGLPNPPRKQDGTDATKARCVYYFCAGIDPHIGCGTITYYIIIFYLFQ